MIRLDGMVRAIERTVLSRCVLPAAYTPARKHQEIGRCKMKWRVALTTVAALLSFMSISSSQAIIIPANPLWTDTGIDLSTSDFVTISASGHWTSIGSVYGWGPGGMPWSGPSYDGFLFNAPEGSLVAYIGLDPYQGHWGDASFFPQTTGYLYVGGNTPFEYSGTDQFTADHAGRLWLGCNDAAVSKNVSDNLFALDVQITVQTVPEPSACTLALLGAGALLGGVRLRRRSS